MSIARWFKRSLENPSVPITASTFRIADGTKHVPIVTEQRALGISAYYRGIALLSGTMAGLPLKVYRKGTRTRIAQTTVLDRPNPRSTPFLFWQTVFANAIPWGNAYCLKVRDGSNTVRQLWPIHPSRVRVENVAFTEGNPEGKVFIVRNLDGTETRYTTWQVLHIPYLAIDGTVGVSPLTVARHMLGVAVAAEDFAGKFFANGTHLSGMITTDADLSDPEAQSLKDRWDSRHAGMSDALGVAVMSNGAKFVPIAIPPEDAQLLETRHFSVVEIARLLGIPPHLVGDVENSTSWGTGIEQQTTGLTKFTLNQWLVNTEQIITAEVLPGGLTSGSWECEWTREGLLQGDSAARSAFYHGGILDGWMTRNEARARENLEPLAGGDDLMVPSNYTLIHEDGSLEPLAQKPDAVPPGRAPKTPKEG